MDESDLEMCGSIAIRYETREITEILGVRKQSGTWAAGDIAYGNRVPVLRWSDELHGLELNSRIWGTSVRGLNLDARPELIYCARSETLTEKPTFQEAVVRKSFGIMPISGFYERGYFFEPVGDRILFAAGLILPDESFVLCTRGAGVTMHSFHNREPLTIRREDIRKWMHPNKGQTVKLGRFAVAAARESAAARAI